TPNLTLCSNACTWRMPGAPGASSCSVPSARNGAIAISSPARLRRNNPASADADRTHGAPRAVSVSENDDDFNFTCQSTVRLSLLGSALAPDFVTEGRCPILGGKPRRGNPPLAVAIPYRAIQNGFDALFVTA